VIIFSSQWVNQRRGICSVIHSIVWLTTGPYPLPDWVLCRFWCSAASFLFQYPLISFQLSSSYLLFLPCLFIISIASFFPPSITCFRRSWPIQLALFFFVVYKCSSPPWLCVITLLSHDQSNSCSPSFCSTTFQNFLGISGLCSVGV